MTTYSNIDIQRPFDTPANLSFKLINGQFAYDTTNDRIAVKRLADGVMKYFENSSDDTYLNADGTTPLTGNWDVNRFSIVNADNITTSDLSADGYVDIEDLTVVTMNVTGDTSVIDLDASGAIILNSSGRLDAGAGEVNSSTADSNPVTVTAASRVIVDPPNDSEDWYNFAGASDGQPLWVINESNTYTGYLSNVFGGSSNNYLYPGFATTMIYDNTLGGWAISPYFVPT